MTTATFALPHTRGHMPRVRNTTQQRRAAGPARSGRGGRGNGAMLRPAVRTVSAGGGRRRQRFANSGRGRGGRGGGFGAGRGGLLWRPQPRAENGAAIVPAPPPHSHQHHNGGAAQTRPPFAGRRTVATAGAAPAATSVLAKLQAAASAGTVAHRRNETQPPHTQPDTANIAAAPRQAMKKRIQFETPTSPSASSSASKASPTNKSPAGGSTSTFAPLGSPLRITSTSSGSMDKGAAAAAATHTHTHSTQPRLDELRDSSSRGAALALARGDSYRSQFDAAEEGLQGLRLTNTSLQQPQQMPVSSSVDTNENIRSTRHLNLITDG